MNKLLLKSKLKPKMLKPPLTPAVQFSSQLKQTLLLCLIAVQYRATSLTFQKEAGNVPNVKTTTFSNVIIAIDAERISLMKNMKSNPRKIAKSN